LSISRKRIVVTGRNGQVARSLHEQAVAHGDLELVFAGRPELDLARPETVAEAVTNFRPDLVVSAAAYTQVDQAESEEALAMTVNAVASGEIARATATLGVPIIHLSTDYVFDGTKSVPYVENDLVAPLGAYGRSKRAGEIAVATANPNNVILRTAWLYSSFGSYFLKTMLRLAQNRDCVRVVDDQTGTPTSASDLAEAILKIAGNLLERDDPALRGIFHLTANGSGSWADFAEEIFRCSRLHGGPSATVQRIHASQYPTAAERPANSRLDCSCIFNLHGVCLPQWKSSVEAAVRPMCLAINNGVLFE
jgi:dTDP-4-dehydrorhamnose reductase